METVLDLWPVYSQVLRHICISHYLSLLLSLLYTPLPSPQLLLLLKIWLLLQVHETPCLPQVKMTIPSDGDTLLLCLCDKASHFLCVIAAYIP
jgi:hypothetical protein